MSSQCSSRGAKHVVSFDPDISIEIANGHARFTDEKTEYSEREGHLPKVTAEEVESHWIPGGCNQRPVPSAPLLPLKGSAVWIWFGALAMAGAELTGVEMDRFSWFGDTCCPHCLPAPSLLQPFPHLKGKDKSKQR